MPRRRVRSEEHYEKAVARGLAAWAGDPEPKTKTRKKRAGIWDRTLARDEVEGFIADRDWTGAAPRHFVELYVRLHGEVYGVEPLDLRTAKPLLAAASLAAKALREHFDGFPTALADFMRWVWIRQAATEKKRRAGTTENDFRVTWRYQWSATLVTQYRRALLTRKT